MKSYKKLHFYAAALAASLLLFACDDTQPDAVLWAKKYLASECTQSAYTVKQTSDKGYIMAGIINRYTTGDMGDAWIAKVSPEGNIQWEKALGGYSLEQGIEGMSVVQTQDGGYAFLARSRSWGFKDENGQDAWCAWVVKLSAAGEVLWQNAYGIQGRGTAPSSLCATSDGGFLIVGSPVIKIDAAGSIQWQQDIAALTGIQDGDGTYSLLGVNTQGTIGYFDTYVIRLDAAGNISWKKNYGAPKIFADAKSIRQAPDGGFIISGSYSPWNSSASRAENDAWLMKLTYSGDVQWSKSYNAGGYQECLNSVDTTSEGGFIAAGYTNRSDAGDVLALKIDGNGIVVGMKAYDAENCAGYEVRRSEAGNYYLTGFSGSSALLIVANKDGAVPGSNLTIKDIKASAVNAGITCRSETVAVTPSLAVPVQTQAGIYIVNSKVTAF